MTRAFVLFAHPCAESFSAALHDCVVKRLTARGWEVDDCDLNAEGFSPVLTAIERRSYHDVGHNIAPVADYVARLKGFFDRVFLPGVSFTLQDGKVMPNLRRIRKLAAVTTYGGTRLRAFMAGDPPRRSVTRAVWHVCRPDKTRYLALYDMNRATDGQRAGFLSRVDAEMERL